MKNYRWSMSAAALCVLALSAYGCSSDPAADDTGDDDDDTTSSSSSGRGGSSSGRGGSSGRSSTSSSSSSSSSSSGGSSGSSSSSSSSSSSGDAGTAPACYDVDGAVPYSLGNQLARSGDCTNTQVDQYITACATDASTQETCDAYFENAANAGCAACMFGGGDDPATRDSGLIDVFGDFSTVCAGNAAGNPAECGSKADNYLYCQMGACGECEAEADVDACVAAATNGPCDALEPAVDCNALFTAQAAAITAACGDYDIENVETFRTQAKYVCGPQL